MKPDMSKEEITRFIENRKHLCFAYAGAAMFQATLGLFAQYPETTIITVIFTTYFIVNLYDQAKWHRKALAYKEEVYGEK